MIHHTTHEHEATKPRWKVVRVEGEVTIMKFAFLHNLPCAGNNTRYTSGTLSRAHAYVLRGRRFVPLTLRFLASISSLRIQLTPAIVHGPISRAWNDIVC
jgi:hypothetical protein